jgi:hypothetical protein
VSSRDGREQTRSRRPRSSVLRKKRSEEEIARDIVGGGVGARWLRPPRGSTVSDS